MSLLNHRSMRQLAERLARRRLLVVLDFDGTLAPQPNGTQDTKVPDRERALLSALTRHVPCAVVSGRSHADLERRLRGMGVGTWVGNHGCDDGKVRWRLARQVAAWKAQLLPAVRAHAGVKLEDKRYSLSVLYGQAKAPRSAKAAIARAAKGLAGATLIDGRQVLNVVAAGSPNKGDAVMRLRWRTKSTAVLFVGDDRSDETVFSLGGDGWLTGVKVGRGGKTSANHRIVGRRQVATLLKAVLDAVSERAAPRTSRRGSKVSAR